MSDFGNYIKELRTQKNMSACKLAKVAGLSTTAISRIENGTGGVKVETLVNYMNILGITPNVIFEKLINSDIYKKSKKIFVIFVKRPNKIKLFMYIYAKTE